MNRITHYAVRDLHALFPDDERYPAWDVVAKASDGTCYYSEDVMDSATEARACIDARVDEPFEFSYWADKRILPENVRVPDGDWIEVPALEEEPSGEAAGRAAYIASLKPKKGSWEDVFGHLGTPDEVGNMWHALTERAEMLRASLNTLADEVIRCTAELNDNGEFPTDTCPADLFTLAHEAKEVATKK